jgi:hypothetical protein
LKNYVNVDLKSKKKKTWKNVRKTGVEESFPMIATMRGLSALLFLIYSFVAAQAEIPNGN